MFSIDGLITGLDTSSIIDGLVSIQQQQIDRLNFQRQEIQVKQASFKGIEAQLLALQGTLGTLSSSTSNLFASKITSSSDESVLTASAGSSAIEGNFSIQVNQLAQAQQIASQQFASAESIITEGTISFQVGNRSAVSVVIDEQNNTVQGLVEAINDADGDVTASVLNDAGGARILLTSKFSGADNTITIDNQLAAGSNNPDFSGDEVQSATNAEITIGSGAGAITATSSTNVFDDIFEGITLRAHDAAPGKTINISVEQDTTGAREAIEDFVDSFNQVVSYIQSQSSFDSENEIAGPLLGFSPSNSILNQLRDEVSRIVPNLQSNANRLSAIGITFTDQGTLQIDSGKLNDAFSGNVQGVDANEIRRLFALDGVSDNSNIDFILGSNKTIASDDPYQVVVTRAAERASITSGSLGSSIVIDGSNNEFSIDIDGVSTGTLSLAHGTYSLTELASHLQDVINQSDELTGQEVAVSVEGSALSITSKLYGSKSSVANASGTAATALQLDLGQTDSGVDVAGYFTVDGQTELATGKGRILTGDIDNENTSGIQLKVSLSNAQLAGGEITSDLTITRGIGSQLNQTIESLLDTESGRIKSSDDAFSQQVESVDRSIDRLVSLFESKKEQLIQEFLALESNVSQLRNTSSFLASQLGGVTSLAGLGGG